MYTLQLEYMNRKANAQLVSKLNIGEEGMIITGRLLLEKSPIKNMEGNTFHTNSGSTYGLNQSGYGIRISEGFLLLPGQYETVESVEEFDMPPSLVGVLYSKDGWVKQGISVINTVINSGYKGVFGFTIVNNSDKHVMIPKHSGIAQVLFHEVRQYENKIPIILQKDVGSGIQG